MPKCCHCKEEKPIDQFYHDRSRATGYTPRCKPCGALSINKELRKVYEKEYWDKRRDDKRAIVLKSFNQNKKHHAEKRKEYLKTEKGIASYKKYTQKRYALRKSLHAESVDIQQLFVENGGHCEYCKKTLLFSEINVDHYVPISRGGEHKKENLKISCASCNKSKGAKMPHEWEVRHPLVQARYRLR